MVYNNKTQKGELVMKRIVISVCLGLLVFVTCGNAKSKPKQTDYIWGEWKVKGAEGYLYVDSDNDGFACIGRDALNFFNVSSMKGEYPDFIFIITFRGDEKFVSGGELIMHFITKDSVWFESRFNKELEESFSRRVKNGADIWIKTGKENVYHRLPERNDDEMTPP
ncbi:MAG TPA: hypothetical protein PK624_08210, partial [Spirochaetota bacterium]|nr:hypothetical protein [Spirochaetota bacterium]HPK56283.1 hypothetical protein [Spirochaetota bacterium]HQE58036.1 hypothetical protein [Spirochaetota bacterium]